MLGPLVAKHKMLHPFNLKKKGTWKYSLLIISTSALLVYGCKNEDLSPWSESTTEVTNITDASATCGGNLVLRSNKYEIRNTGVCWSTNPNPTTADGFTRDGNGAGTFISSITYGLRPNTTYYVRAYAEEYSGETLYGNQVSLKTHPALPFTSVTAGYLHSLAIKSSGTLWAWGDNSNGECGVSPNSHVYWGFFNTIGNAVPPWYTPLSLVEAGYSSVSAGTFFTIGVKTDGTLYGWGRNYSGAAWYDLSVESEFGGGPAIIPILAGSGYSSVAAGDLYSLAFKTDGTLWVIGANAANDNGVNGRIPSQIGSDYVSVAAGDNHSLALKNDGTLWAWGDNHKGQLGDGTTADRYEPVQIGSGYAFAAAGFMHSIAIKTDGTLWAWGSNSEGQLGDGTTDDKSTPVLVGSGFVSAAGGGTGYSCYTCEPGFGSFTLAIKTDGSLWAWGYNHFGQLGDGTTVDKKTPMQIGSGYASVAAGAYHSLAIKTDGTLWAWGGNHFGQVGDGTTVDQYVPVKIE